MPTHKIANNFIRKYNKEFSIKGYSKLKISDKLKLISKVVSKNPKMKTEWNNILKRYDNPVPVPAKAGVSKEEFEKVRKQLIKKIKYN